MEFPVWITYVLASIILCVSPGPGVFSSISSGLHHGFRLGIWNAVGGVMRDPSRLRLINRGFGGAFVAAGMALATFRRTGSAAAL